MKLEDVVKLYGNKLDNVCTESFRDISGKIRDRTPVDTGLLKGSWTVGINQIDAGDWGWSFSEAQIDSIKAGDTLYLGNPQPYAPRIEHEGWSKKAPNGMMWISVAQWQQIVNSTAKRVKDGN